MKTKTITVTVTGNLFWYDQSTDKKLIPYLDDGYTIRMIGAPIVTKGERETFLTQTFVLEKLYEE